MAGIEYPVDLQKRSERFVYVVEPKILVEHKCARYDEIVYAVDHEGMSDE